MGNKNYEATFKLCGHILEIGKVQTFPSGFQKVDVTLDCTRGNYPNHPTVTFVKDSVNLLETFRKEDSVVIEGFIDGREWNGKRYNSLSAKSIKMVSTEEMPF